MIDKQFSRREKQRRQEEQAMKIRPIAARHVRKRTLPASPPRLNVDMMPEVEVHKINISANITDKRQPAIRTESRLPSPMTGFNAKNSARSFYHKSINEDVSAVYSGQIDVRENSIISALDKPAHFNQAAGTQMTSISMSLTKKEEPSDITAAERSAESRNEIHMMVKTPALENPLHLKLDLKPTGETIQEPQLRIDSKRVRSPREPVPEPTAMQLID